MDFFEHQTVARRKTGRLILLFSLAVVCIVLAVYAVVVILFAAQAGDDALGKTTDWGIAWNPTLLVAVSVITLTVIGLGSLFKIVELSGGGEKVALMLGGRLIDPGTRDLNERRLLNVVEEMSIASGTPVPPVYVMDGETSINAFAAGYAPGDAVVAVTRGTINHLNRDELQGVVAHEFSHILNGDMRLNVRLIGLLNGILLLSTIGYILMRVAGTGHRSSNRKNNSGAGIVLLGIALFVLGYIGVFFGRLIKASVSRQREFLADASAVQFTRQPAGLAGALKKIGGLTNQSRIKDPHAAEASHMFFGDAFAGSMFNLLATHPPLKERIQRIDPAFDGRFTVTEVSDVEPRHTQSSSADLVSAELVSQGLHDTRAERAQVPFDADKTLANIGTPQGDHLIVASALLEHISEPLKQLVHEPYSARAIILALLIDRDVEIQHIQHGDLASQADPQLARLVDQAASELGRTSRLARLPLTEMALPSLKQLSSSQYGDFRQLAERLVRADQRVSLGEYVLWKFVFGQLDEHFGLRRRAKVRYHSMKPLTDELLLILSVFAHVGHPSDLAGAQRFFTAGTLLLEIPDGQIVARDVCTLTALDAAVTKWAQASLPLKRQALMACAAVVAADNQTTVDEAELLRAVAELLGCPLPPQLPQIVDQPAN